MGYRKRFSTITFTLCRIVERTAVVSLINSYTTGLSSKVLENLLSLTVVLKFGGTVSSGEVGLPITDSSLVLPCGIYGRWDCHE